MIYPEVITIIVDASNQKRDLVVVAENTHSGALDREAQRLGCEVYKEQGEELYRLICERKTAKSED